MDGVVVDFDGHLQLVNALRSEHKMPAMTGDDFKRMSGAYLGMPPIAGAIEGVRSIIGMGFDVWLATKPPTGIAWAYADKAEWVFRHLPELKRKLIITHDKGMLGGNDDVLVDDRPHKANCMDFRGTLITFGMASNDVARERRPRKSIGVPHWEDLLCVLREFAPNRSTTRGWMVEEGVEP